jgi:type IV pilus assembly protein PilO
MKLSELNDLDFNDAGGWPPTIKAIAILIVIAAVGAAGYWFDSKVLLEELDASERKEQELRQQVTRKQKVLANIDAYRAQLRELKGMLDTMLQQLPTRTEMPDLLEDISNTGRVNGLDFELFKPEGEQPRDFYAAKPISIRARATYHQFGAFVSSIAAMSRIVTLEKAKLSADVSRERGPKNSIAAAEDESLIIEATLQTYRYLDEDKESIAPATEAEPSERNG